MNRPFNGSNLQRWREAPPPTCGHPATINRPTGRQPDSAAVLPGRRSRTACPHCGRNRPITAEQYPLGLSRKISGSSSGSHLPSRAGDTLRGSLSTSRRRWGSDGTAVQCARAVTKRDGLWLCAPPHHNLPPRFFIPSSLPAPHQLPLVVGL